MGKIRDKDDAFDTQFGTELPRLVSGDLASIEFNAGLESQGSEQALIFNQR
jgi:hypothetical protein